jgi:hypothetical protein
VHSAQTPEEKSFWTSLSDSVNAVSASASVSVKAERVLVCQCKSRSSASVSGNVKQRQC